MQFILSATTLLLAASSALASPAVRRQATPDTKVRVTLRDDAGGKEDVLFQTVNNPISTGVSGIFTTLEVDVGSDANSALRCAVTAGDDVKIFANRGQNLDDTFSDATNGEWTFVDGPTEIAVVRCDPGFVADNRNAA